MAKEKNNIHYPDQVILGPCGGILFDSNVFEVLEVEDREYVTVKGGGEATNYETLENKPKINGVELLGDKSSEDLKIRDGVWEFSVSGVAPSFVSDKPYADIKQAIDDGYNVVCNYGGFKFPLLKNNGGNLDFGGVAQIVETDGEDNARIFDVTVGASSIAVDEAVVGLRMASETVLGGVKVGEGLEIDDNGVLSVAEAELTYFIVEGNKPADTLSITTPWADIAEAYTDGKELRLQYKDASGKVVEVPFANYNEGSAEFEFGYSEAEDDLNASIRTIVLAQNGTATKCTDTIVPLKDDAPFIVTITSDDGVENYTYDKTAAEVGIALAEGREVIVKGNVPISSNNNLEFRLERVIVNGTEHIYYFYAINDTDTTAYCKIRRLAISDNTTVQGKYLDYVIPREAATFHEVRFNVDSSTGEITAPTDPTAFATLVEKYNAGAHITASAGTEKLVLERVVNPTGDAEFIFIKENLVGEIDGAGRTSYNQDVVKVSYKSSGVANSHGVSNEFITIPIEGNDTSGYSLSRATDVYKLENLTHQRAAFVFNGALYTLNGFDSATNTYTFSTVIAEKDNKLQKLKEDSFKYKILGTGSYELYKESAGADAYHIVEIARGTTGSWTFNDGSTWNWDTVKKCMDGGNLVYLHDGEQNFFVPTHTASDEHVWECFKIESVATDDGGMRDALVRYTASIKADETKTWTRTQFDYAHKTVAMITVDETDPTKLKSSKTSADINTSNGAGNIVQATHNGNIYQLVSSTPSSAQFVATTYDNTKGEFTDHYIYVNGSAVAVVDKPRLECIPVIRYKTNTGGVAHAGFYPIYATEVLNQTNTYRFIAEDLPVPVDPAGVKTFVAWHIDSESGDVAAAGNAILDDVVLYAEWEV